MTSHTAINKEGLLTEYGRHHRGVELAVLIGFIYFFNSSTPGGNTLSAAEHTCALICSLARLKL